MKKLLSSPWFLAATVAVALLLLFVARRAEVVGPDGVTRVTMAVTGLALAWYGNLAPKERPATTARGIATLRLAGYTFTLAGLANAAIWLWAPMESAATLSMVPVLAGLLGLVGYCGWQRADA